MSTALSTPAAAGAPDRPDDPDSPGAGPVAGARDDAVTGPVGAPVSGTIEPPGAGGSAGGLSRAQKAAIIVRLLLAEGADLPLASLPERTQLELVRQMAQLRRVDQATVNQVVEEFLETLNAGGLSFPGALESALDLMDGALDPALAERLRKEAGITRRPDPWEKIEASDNETLVELLGREGVEVGAVVLSKLNVTKAAELLGMMPGERARRMAYAVSLTSEISPAVVERIGQALAAQLGTSPPRAFDTDPVERVGAILNFSPAATRDQVLEGLEETDAEFAGNVRRAIFTFADIPARIHARDVPRLTRDVEQSRLVLALAGAQGDDAAAAEFILSNLSNRMADTLREEMEDLGKVKQKDVEAAMTDVVIAIRNLLDSGEIQLVEPDEDEEEG